MDYAASRLVLRGRNGDHRSAFRSDSSRAVPPTPACREAPGRYPLLELRKSTYADARRIVDRWRRESRDLGPYRGEWCDVEISFSNFAWNQSTFILNTPVRSRIFRWLVARPAAVDATIRVRNSVVLGKTIEEYVTGPCDESNGFAFCRTVMGRARTGERRFIDSRHPEYSIFRPSGCLGCVDAQVVFSPYANPADVRRLTDLNFACITQWSPCETESDILPTAWAQSETEHAQSLDAIGSCAGTVRALSRQMRHVPLASVENVVNAGEGPQITVRWEEPPRPLEHDRQQNVFPVSNGSQVRKGERLLIFESEVFHRIDACAITPATEENLRVAREGVSEDLSDHVNPPYLPFGEVRPPSVDMD